MPPTTNAVGRFGGMLVPAATKRDVPIAITPSHRPRARRLSSTPGSEDPVRTDRRRPKQCLSVSLGRVQGRSHRGDARPPSGNNYARTIKTAKLRLSAADRGQDYKAAGSHNNRRLSALAVGRVARRESAANFSVGQGTSPAVSVPEVVPDWRVNLGKYWSEWQDLNLRPPRPQLDEKLATTPATVARDESRPTRK